MCRSGGKDGHSRRREEDRYECWSSEWEEEESSEVRGTSSRTVGSDNLTNAEEYLTHI